VVLGFELRALRLLDRHSTPRATLPSKQDILLLAYVHLFHTFLLKLSVFIFNSFLQYTF
jgi:hypothetical protein